MNTDLADIEAQGWSLNPGRYVGVAEQAPGPNNYGLYYKCRGTSIGGTHR